VKRLLVLVAALPMVAALLVPASAGAQAQLVSITRANPRQVTISTTPRRDRFLPFRFTTTGRVIPPTRFCNPGEIPGTGARSCIQVLCPPGQTDIRYCLIPGRGVVCTGNVNVRVQKKSTTISSRIVNLRPNCTYRSQVTFSTLLRTRTGTLSFRSRFGGNAVMLPRNSRTIKVRAG
jgi:hypothetical protein